MNKPAPAPPEPPMSRRKALLKLGFFQPIDVLYLILVLVLCATGVWRLSATGATLDVLVFMLGGLVVGQLWIITLCFRIAWFVLSAQADINLLPEAAARIVLGYQQRP